MKGKGKRWRRRSVNFWTWVRRDRVESGVRVIYQPRLGPGAAERRAFGRWKHRSVDIGLRHDWRGGSPAFPKLGVSDYYRSHLQLEASLSGDDEDDNWRPWASTAQRVDADLVLGWFEIRVSGGGGHHAVGQRRLYGLGGRRETIRQGGTAGRQAVQSNGAVGRLALGFTWTESG